MHLIIFCLMINLKYLLMVLVDYIIKKNYQINCYNILLLKTKAREKFIFIILKTNEDCK